MSNEWQQREQNIVTLFFASFLHVLGVQIDFAPKYQNVLHFFPRSSHIDPPCSGDMCRCCPQQAVCASGLTQCPCRGPAFVSALFGDARPIYCATCIPRPDNDEYRYERTAFQNWNKFPSQCGNLARVRKFTASEFLSNSYHILTLN